MQLMNSVIHAFLVCMLILIAIPTMIAIIVCGSVIAINVLCHLGNIINISKGGSVLWYKSFRCVLKLPSHTINSHEFEYSNCVLM